ncbi:NADH dehydrogenase (ubiquinone) Fe-S protein 6 [Clonorchis sinensis]|uniref:NADH dehydrogenase (Ubiquinone) Fe-S protein 6 n=1 Tax=Clonorchis sinensis TaxID=79923 RepID=G7YTR4_CLOSI|nr:NADH dehydrogenase (ubiquinone) Fe-S protein 6 [Clonorchis sinensis]
MYEHKHTAYHLQVNRQFAEKLIAEVPPIPCTEHIVSCDGGGGLGALAVSQSTYNHDTTNNALMPNRPSHAVTNQVAFVAAGRLGTERVLLLNSQSVTFSTVPNVKKPTTVRANRKIVLQDI